MSAVSVSEDWLLRVILFGFVCRPISFKKINVRILVSVVFVYVFILTLY